MLHIVNYKRMLDYSSIENMGILFLGVALGAPGVYAALLHSAAHSLAKASLFLTSGNIVTLYGSKRVAEVRGLLRREPRTGWLWLTSLLAISGAPPFPSFLSKFLLVQAFFAAGTGWMAAPFLLFVTVVFLGMGGAVAGMAFGEAPSGAPDRGKPAIWAFAPQWMLLLLLLGIGLGVPAPVQTLIREAAAFLR